MAAPGTPDPRRNKGFAETHQDLIECAVRIISEKGVGALSIAALARAVRINRTTVYYHFKSREALLAAVRHWSSEQLTRGLSLAGPQGERMDYIIRFVLENPVLIKLWIDDFISPGDIRDRYPRWDVLVEGMSAAFSARVPGEKVDVEVYCAILLTGAIVGPRVFKNSVAPADDDDTVISRFRRELQRQLKHDALSE
jgi:AcrR family transcriptional regulator